MSFKTQIQKNLSNVPGWRTNQKLLVIESDDWGSLRMPSLNTFNSLEMQGLDFSSGDAARYNLNDTLASAQDLEALYGVLCKFIDRNGKHPVFTPVSLVANPDFEKIKSSDFQEYFYEPFTTTLKRYNHENAFLLWQQGIQEQLFIPQFHGREHLNVAVWMRALQANDREARLAFEKECWGFHNKHRLGIAYQSAFDLEHITDLRNQENSIKEGLQLFEEIFGYKARFFVPPNGPFNNYLEGVAADAGIRYMSASKMQLESLGEGKRRKVLHWLGQKNKYGQRYITRNCFFEPSMQGPDWISDCLQDILTAFRWGKPAIISSHRVNYIGGLNEKNRTNGLLQLHLLLENIVKKWPDVEFMSSDKLGDLINTA